MHRKAVAERPSPDILRLTTEDQAILHWKDFSIQPHESVQFLQPSSTSAVLNRVRGGQASQILGHLESNGKVYLINPHGIVFGKEAVINVAELLASTYDLTDEAFLLGQEIVLSGDSHEAIINDGRIETTGGNLLLIGRRIENRGELLAPQGTVALAAGQEIILRYEEIPILEIRPGEIREGEILQGGSIQALIADLQAEGRPFSYGINIQGTITALHTVERSGQVYLKTDQLEIAPQGVVDGGVKGTVAIETSGRIYQEGTVTASGGTLIIQNLVGEEPLYNLGTLDVSGSQGGTLFIDVAKMLNAGKVLAEGAEGGAINIRTRGPYIETVQGELRASGKQNGGTISIESETSLFSSGTHLSCGAEGGMLTLLAPRVALVSASLDVSGKRQGGSIFIGGGPYGEKKGLCNAIDVEVTGDTSLQANATQDGNGGTIVVWSEGNTVCYGKLSAHGGASQGDGGWIEVSGKESFHCGAEVLASATNGRNGEVWIDPKNVTIDATLGIYPQYVLIDPNSGGGTGFGTAVTALSMGNLVVTKPGDNFAATSAGAVYLYNGLTAALLSTITGSVNSDQVGSGGVTTLASNGNYVIRSPSWHTGGFNNVGAATWGSGITGVTGAVSASNSLVGDTASDQVGSGGILALTNGHYVVGSSAWHSSTGAASFGNGTTGVSGAISSSNSLVGDNTGQAIGSAPFGPGLVALTNGNYVVSSPSWTSGGNTVGAATWGNGTTGITGSPNSTNSLVGSQHNDQVGQRGSVALANGNYVVLSARWANGGSGSAGAATWGNGATGITGAVTSSNSLVGTRINDEVSSNDVLALTNGNYVVISPSWDLSGATTSVGAATWGDGTTGITGAVSVANSITGSSTNDQIGSHLPDGGVALTNGNYAIISPNWFGFRGAVTWGDGTTGTVLTVSAANSIVGGVGGYEVGGTSVTALTNGNYVILSQKWGGGQQGAVTWASGTASTGLTVSAANSLVGSAVNDLLGNTGLVALSNGSYVVGSSFWNGGRGAATWGSGTAGVSGTISAANSLIGGALNDLVSSDGIVALTNGNYVVVSRVWNGTVGAVTWGNGSTGTSGTVSALNSLVGSTGGDQIGSGGVTALANGNYVVRSPLWNNTGVVPSVTDAGAVTWGSGTSGVIGNPSSTNSLIGSATSDQAGSGGVLALANGDYVISSPLWNNASVVPTLSDAGAATWGSGTVGITGTINSQNSILGQSSSGGLTTSVEDSVNSSFVARFLTESTSGRIRIGIYNPNSITFARAQAQDMVITPSFVATTLNAGTNVTLQTNNDLTVANAITSSGSGGLTLRAGRSALINGNISLSNAPLAVVANDLLSNGVVNAYRDAGNAVLTVASGVALNVGAANLTLSLLNGAGKTNFGSGNLEIGAAASCTCSGSGAMTLTAQENDVILRTGASLQTQNGGLSITAGNDVTTENSVAIITTGTGAMSLLAETGNVDLGASTSCTCSGSGVMTLTAETNNIVLGASSSLQTVSGQLLLSAGVNITASGVATVRTMGTGTLIVLSDNLFPTAPLFGSGRVTMPSTTLTTGGGRLLIYTAQRSLNTMPATLNGVAFVPGPEFVDSTTEEWGVYYPSSSGVPFTIFYKEDIAPVPPPPPTPRATTDQEAKIALYRTAMGVAGVFQAWQNFWFDDTPLAADPYPPYYTPKRLHLPFPSLVSGHGILRPIAVEVETLTK